MDGQVVEVLVKDGMRIKKRQPMVVLETMEYEVKYNAILETAEYEVQDKTILDKFHSMSNFQ